MNLHRFRTFAAPLLLVSSFGVSLVPATVHAQTGGTGLGGKLSQGLQQAAPKELQGASNLSAIIGSLISAAIGFLGVLLFVYLLWGGFLWMTAGGDTGKVKDATAVIRNAIIGLVIIASAYAISTFVITQLGNITSGAGAGQGASSPNP
jgi:hypothetical protein